MLFGNLGDESGVVVGGEGIRSLGARSFQELVEYAVGVIFGALEHQMFEEVRESGVLAFLVSRADAKPGLVGDRR